MTSGRTNYERINRGWDIISDRIEARNICRSLHLPDLHVSRDLEAFPNGGCLTNPQPLQIVVKLLSAVQDVAKVPPIHTNIPFMQHPVLFNYT